MWRDVQLQPCFIRVTHPTCHKEPEMHREACASTASSTQLSRVCISGPRRDMRVHACAHARALDVLAYSLVTRPGLSFWVEFVRQLFPFSELPF